MGIGYEVNIVCEKQFVVNELEILNEENEWKGEYWWAVVNTQRVEDCFECRNKEVALELCDFLNKATDDFKWQIKQSEKWSAKVKQLKEENEQLKKENKEFKQIINFCSNEEEDALVQVIRENEQLRKELNCFKPVMFQDMRKGTVILYSKGDDDE